MAKRFSVIVLVLLNTIATTAFRRGTEAAIKSKGTLQVSKVSDLPVNATDDRDLQDHVQNTTNTEWLEALNSGDVEDVKRLIEARASINQVDDDLNVSVGFCLLKHGSRACQPLCVAATAGHVAVVKALISAGANVNQTTEWNQTVLDEVRYDGNNANNDESIAVQKALRSAAGPLFAAAADGHVEALAVLIKSNANVDQRGANGETPLISAADLGHKAIVQALITANAAVGPWDKHGETPVFVAAQSDREGVVELLVEAKAEVNIPNNNLMTPLCLVKSKGVAQRLIMAKADINYEPSMGDSPLTWAITLLEDDEEYGWNRAGVVQALLAARADVNVQKPAPLTAGVPTSQRSRTPLDMASLDGFVDVAKALVTAKANVNHVGWNDNTPLFCAVSRGHEQLVRFLLDAAADVNIVNANGKTPLSSAKERGHTIIMEMLSVAAAKSNGSRLALNIVEMVLLMLLPFVGSI